MTAGTLRAVVLGLLMLGNAAATPAIATPTEQVESFNGALLAAMQDADTLGFDGRYDLLAPVAERVFDFATMARIAAGTYWRDLESAQQDQLVALFSRMSVSTFAARFNDYAGERFEIGGEKPALRGNVLVENHIVTADGKAVPINYLFRQTDGGEWRVVDILLEAKYSELAVRRSEYSSILKSEGFAGLVDRIEDSIADLRKRAGA